MARKMQIVLNRPEISKQILRGKGTQAFLLSVADRVANQSGLSCETRVSAGSVRAHASVAIADTEDYFRNLHTNALASALY